MQAHDKIRDPRSLAFVFLAPLMSSVFCSFSYSFPCWLSSFADQILSTLPEPGGASWMTWPLPCPTALFTHLRSAVTCIQSCLGGLLFSLHREGISVETPQPISPSLLSSVYAAEELTVTQGANSLG